MESLRYRNFWLSSGFALMIAILFVALSPSNRTIAITFLSDKMAHALTFVVLMIWFCGLFRLRLAPVIAISLLLYGLLIEYLQSFLPYRAAEWGDVVFDLGGILLGWMLAAAGLRKWPAIIESLLGAKNTSL